MGTPPKVVKVALLTQQQCAFCEQAKEMLSRLAAEYPLSVSTLDVGTAEGQEAAERGGVLFPPGILLDSEPFSYGRPSEKKLRREIERRLSLAG
jgi:thiol-disulfide isomerase/thioredoxin